MIWVCGSMHVPNLTRYASVDVYYAYVPGIDIVFQAFLHHKTRNDPFIGSVLIRDFKHVTQESLT